MNFLKHKWVVQVFFLSFFLSAIFSGASSFFSDFNVWILVLILLLVIAIGIVFDMIGVAVLTAEEAPFHARSAKKIKEARTSIQLLKNSTKVSSICNDIVGDICGIVSGSLGATLTLYLITVLKVHSLLATILVTSFISSLTVGGKAYFKNIATKNSDAIVFFVGKIMHLFK